MKNTNNWKSFKNGKRVSGYITRRMPLEREKEDPAAKDRENRKQVVERIEKALENGSTLEEIVTELANDEEIKQKFKYFSKLDLKEIFKGWYKGRKRPERGIEKSERRIMEF